MADVLEVGNDIQEGAQLDIFGEVHNPFESVARRMGFSPTSVWEISGQDKQTRELKALINDIGDARGGTGEHFRERKPGDTQQIINPIGRAGTYQSIFDPTVAARIVSLYSVEGDQLYDPFAGGGTRAIMAAAYKRAYRGVELRPGEVEATRARISATGMGEHALVEQGDARDTVGTIPDRFADGILTCPPYWNLERYEGGPDDLSMMPLEGYVEGIRAVARDCYRVAKPGAQSVWVIGLHRDHSTGEVVHLPDIVREAHLAAGWLQSDEAIIHRPNSPAKVKVGQVEKGRGFLLRMHEYVLVFGKPDPLRKGVPPRRPLIAEEETV